ncbi:MAG TPA: hypothetical protein VGK33_06655, partial [Chloroflexota bacterium]
MAVVGTLALYQPWRALPFEIVDFSEFLPFLRLPTFAERWHAFLHYYGALGRWNILGYLGLIAKWTAFGTHTEWWQTARFIQMWAIVAGVYLLLRRFGADRSGAAAGAGLFTVAVPAVPAWVRLTMGEPSGFLCLLAALLLATGYRRSVWWVGEGLAIALLVALALLTKEMLVAMVPFVVVVGSCVAAPGSLAWPKVDRRTLWLIALTALSVAAVLIHVADVARGGGFTSAYTARLIDWRSLITNFGAVALPMRGSRPSVIGQLSAPANALLLALLLIAGVLVAVRGSASGLSRGQAFAWIALALSLPCAVVAAYQPWSFFQDFYGLPFLLGTAMLVAAAVTVVDRSAPLVGVLARAACVMILLLAGAAAVWPVRQSMARRAVHGALAGYLVTHDIGAPVIVMSDDIFGIPWQGPGPTLRRYALALYPEAQLGNFADAHCAVPPHRFAVNGRQGVVVTYASNCRSYPGATATFRETYRYPILWPPALRRDSVRVDVCGER